ncbi:MAG: hypothetical protein C0434_07980 [Xanthomonadaceae bacterium]|nr:hypothetical protein [Xanthomonadaceae bacterium]
MHLILPYPISAPGVYRITDSSSGRFYIGSSVNIAKRWAQHQHRLARGTHPNPMLQAIWSVNPARLSIAVVRLTASDRSELLNAEQVALDASRVGSNPLCMNVLRVAGSHLGRKRTAETRARLAAANTGKQASDETRAKQRAAKLGKPLSVEHRRKLSNARRGLPGTPRAGIPRPTLRRFTDTQVASIRADRAAGMSWRLLALEYGVAKGTVKRIATGVTYRRACQ